MQTSEKIEIFAILEEMKNIADVIFTSWKKIWAFIDSVTAWRVRYNMGLD